MRKFTLLFIIAAAFFITSCSPKAETADLSLEQQEKGPLNIEAFGIIKAKNTVNLTLGFAASVEKVNVFEGQRVKKGDSIITIDLKPLYQQIQEKEIELRNLKNEEEALKKELEKEWTDMPEADKYNNDKKYAKASYEEALKDMDIQKKIFESGAISQYEYSSFEKSMESKKKILEEIFFEESKAQYIFSETKQETALKLRSIEGKIEGIQSVLRSLKDKLKISYIKDSDIISGMENALVYDISSVPGDILTEGKKAASLMDMDTLYVEANVNEEFIKDVSVGSEVQIIPEADKSKEYKGKVTNISQGAVNINGQTSIPVHIEIKDKDDFLRPNFNVEVKILIK